jgi:hypothetical protein
MKQRTRKVNSSALGITTDTLAMLCWQHGFRGVPALARKIGRHEKTLWCAVRWPDRYGPTFKLIAKELEAAR